MAEIEIFEQLAEKFEAFARDSEGMARAAYGHGATLMGESYAQSAKEQIAKAAEYRRLAKEAI